MAKNTLEDYEKIYFNSSTTLSNINRQIVFAGVALIWIFTTDENVVPSNLVLPAILLVGSLVFDIIQYAYTTIVTYRKYKRCEKKKLPETHKFDHSVWFFRPTWIFFGIKVALTFVAYMLIFRFLWTTLVE